jgi:hypothetical protein
MEMKDIFFVNVLKHFDHILIREKYLLKRLNYNPIVDDDYELYYESNSNTKIGISIRLALYYETLSIVLSCPKSNVLSSIGIEYDGYYEWGKSRMEFSLEDVLKKFKQENFFKQQITEEKLIDIIKQSANLIQNPLMPIIRGEKWIDKLII